jgi:hypothetical protein
MACGKLPAKEFLLASKSWSFSNFANSSGMFPSKLMQVQWNVSSVVIWVSEEGMGQERLFHPTFSSLRLRGKSGSSPTRLF